MTDIYMVAGDMAIIRTAVFDPKRRPYSIDGMDAILHIDYGEEHQQYHAKGIGNTAELSVLPGILREPGAYNYEIVIGNDGEWFYTVAQGIITVTPKTTNRKE